MPLLAALAVAVAVPVPVPVADGAYRGDGVALVVRDRAVVGVRATVRRYACRSFGEIGPLRVRARGVAAPIGPDGRVTLTTGVPSERLVLRARFDGAGRAVGRLRVRGTIATGDPCRSPRVRFVVGLSS